MKFIQKILLGAGLLCLIFGARGSAQPAGENLGLFVLGLSGSHEFKTYFDQAPERLRKVLLLNGYRPEELVKYSEAVSSPGGEEKWGKEEISSKENLEKYFSELKKEKKNYHEVFVFVAAHANGRDEEAMMHLPGDDITYREMLENLNGLSAEKMTVVVAAAQGDVWIQKLAKPGRVVIAGNGYRQYDFIPMPFLRFFPEMFKDLSTAAVTQPAAPEVQVSLLDVFAATQKKIRHWYKQNKLHCTEMALIDADGDAKGDSLYEKKKTPDVKKEETASATPAPQVLKEEETDEELPLDLNLPDAKAANEIHYIVRKGETNESEHQ